MNKKQLIEQAYQFGYMKGLESQRIKTRGENGATRLTEIADLSLSLFRQTIDGNFAERYKELSLALRADVVDFDANALSVESALRELGADRYKKDLDDALTDFRKVISPLSTEAKKLASNYVGD